METQPHNPQVTEVRVVDFDMSVISLITLFIKMAIASIPAMLIIWFISLLFGAVAMGLLGIGGSILGG